MRISSIMLAALVIFAGSIATRAATVIPETMELSVGEIVMLKLPGNRRAGYRWMLNKTLSRGLDLVTVDQVGWIMAPEAKTLFLRKTLSVLNIAVRGRAAGEADLAFDYYRFWGNRATIKTITIKVIVRPAAVSDGN